MSEQYTVLTQDVEESEHIEQFKSDVDSGLSGEPKSLPCKYIYDARGSRLFSQIMELDEYYLTNCETAILEANAQRICEEVWQPGLNVVELGAGDGKKTRILLECLIDKRKGFNYVPIDISESAVRGLTTELSARIPTVEMHGLVAEYHSGIKWLSGKVAASRNLVLFLGSSIGNFDRDESGVFLSSLRDAMGDNDYLLVGFDLQKDISVMRAAYDDALGVTAEFNLNLLMRINRELGGQFDKDKFRFHSMWDSASGAIQSYLVSREKQDVGIAGLDKTVSFESDEAIHTESSHKYTLAHINEMAKKAGLEVIENFKDPQSYFVNVLMRPMRSMRPMCPIR